MNHKTPLYSIVIPVFNSDKIISVSEYLVEIAQKTYNNSQKYITISNGTHFRHKIINSKIINNKPQEIINILSVSRIVESKGIQDVLAALKILRYEKSFINFNYTVIGSGAYKNQLIELTKQMNLSDYVRFLGFVENDKLAMYYAKSDYFILPSHTEAFGIVFLEAIAHNLPCIGSRIGGIPEVINPNVGILVNAKDHRSIANGIWKMNNSFYNYKSVDFKNTLDKFSINNSVDCLLLL